MNISYSVLPMGLATAVTYIASTYTARALSRGGVSMPAQSGRFGCIDGLRGYLALSVMIFHFLIWMELTRSVSDWVPGTINPFLSLGAGSVGIFFMVTGFLFYPRILRGFSATAWPATYIGRLFRIVPLTVFSILLVTLIIMARTGVFPDRTYLPAAAEWLTGWKEPPLLGVLGMAGAARTNCYVLWTLWYEWMFYLLALPLCALVSDVMRHRMPSWLLPAGLLTGALLARHTRGFGGWPTYFPLFVIGMLAFECQRNERLRARLGTRIMGAPAVMCLAIGMLRQSNPYGELQLPLYGFFFLVVSCGNDLGGVLSTRGARLLGECSFGIYLMHSLLLSLIFVDGAAVIAYLPISTLPIVLPPAAILVVFFCALLHIGLERRAMRVGKIIINQLSSSRVLISGARAHIAGSSPPAQPRHGEGA